MGFFMWSFLTYNTRFSYLFGSFWGGDSFSFTYMVFSETDSSVVNFDFSPPDRTFLTIGL